MNKSPLLVMSASFTTTSSWASNTTTALPVDDYDLATQTDTERWTCRETNKETERQTD